MRPGELIDRYRVVGRLGSGGMGEVYLVDNPELGRREALKVLSAGGVTLPGFEERFRREARAIATLEHPGIVTVHNAGVDRGRPWYTMSYVEGADLAGERLQTAEVVAVISAVAAALDYAHSRNMIHRDVKPANIMITRTADGVLDRVLLLDFGIAKLADSTQLTGTGAFIGTVAYTAPEALSGHVDRRADQYSLACAAYALLAGSPPFTGDGLSPMAVASAHMFQPVPPVSSHRPDLAAADPVFRRALAKDPAARFPDCRAFAHALRSALESGATVPVHYPLETRPPNHAGHVLGGASERTYPLPSDRTLGTASVRPERKRPRAALAVALVLVLVIAAVGGVIGYQQLRGLDGAVAHEGQAVAQQEVAMALASMCAISRDRGLYCWGRGDVSRSPTAVNNTPQRVPGITEVSSVGASIRGRGHLFNYCALSNRSVACWGNTDSKLIDRDSVTAGSLFVRNPVPVPGLPPIVQLSLGGGNACAITEDAQLYCWGGNLGREGWETPVPTQIGELSGVTDVSVGEVTSCAIADNTVWCWGANDSGQLGRGELTDMSTGPVQLSGRATAVTVGDTYVVGDTGLTDATVSATVCAVVEGNLYCWGDNGWGQLGTSSDEPRNRPARVPGLTGVTSVSSSFGTTCAVVQESAYCWGVNSWGQVGNGQVTEDKDSNQFRPSRVEGLPGRVVAIETHWGTTCARVAIDSTGGQKLYCWGQNIEGLFSDEGEKITRPVKVELPD